MYAHMREKDQTLIKRNAHQYQGGEYKEIVENGLVWYYCPRQVPGKPNKLTSVWMGPYRVVKKIPPNLVKITAAHTQGRDLTVSVARLKIYKTDPNLEHRRMPRERTWEEDDDSEAEDIIPFKERVGGNIVIPIQIGVPTTDMVDLAEAMKDPVATEETPVATRHVEVEDAVLPDTEDENMVDESMVAGPPTVNERRPEPNQVPTQRREKRKRIILNPNTDGSASEQEKTLPKRNRWKDLLPGSSSEWETDGEVNMIKRDSIMVPRLRGSQLPYKATEGSAAYDLRAPVNATVMPGGRLVLDLNFSAAIPEGYALQLSSRSGLASQGLWTLAGVIDSDYRGSIKAILFNSNSSAFKITKGQRITQAFLFRTYEVEWQEVERLPSTNRGDGGLGSTGKT